MDVRRVGEALLRSHPTNLFSAFSRPTQQRSRLLSNRNVSRHISETSRRTFSSSTSRPQKNAPKEDDSPPQNSTKASESPSGQEQPQQTRKIANPLFGNILNSTLGRSGVNGETTKQRTTASGSRSNNNTNTKQTKPSSLDFLRSQAQKGSSLDDAGTQHAAAMTAQHASSSTKQPTNYVNIREMLKNTILESKQGLPPRSGAWKFPAGGASAAAAADVKHSLMEPPDVDNLPRLGPSYGRTVAVYDTDLPGALRRMDMRVNSNGIRKAYHSQKFHERPGLKRKRLASARWRNRFMQGFKATVQTVKHLKRQGW
ncbi:mitochondrial 37S ribosomal protein bS21m [Phyllosticta citribraziliensis]|uniref:Ribosomal protein S21 n=1 Tax=Phyllosticta citribraziliensis TaxID=989973 RepID=A0ABR1LX22_9PEZI